MSPLALVSLVVFCAFVIGILSLRAKLKTLQAAFDAATMERDKIKKTWANDKLEMSKLKEDVQRKAKSLDEVRDNMKKKLRKQGMAEGASSIPGQPAGDNMESDTLKRAVSAVEGQFHGIKQELIAEKEQALALRDKESALLKSKIEDLESKLKSKRQPRLDGTSLSLQDLPEPVANEIARIYRKAEEGVRLYGVAQSKLQLAQERFSELQRRYFAVCRELAVAAGSTPSTDIEARDTAETVIQYAETQEAAPELNTAPSPSSQS